MKQNLKNTCVFYLNSLDMKYTRIIKYKFVRCLYMTTTLHLETLCFKVDKIYKQK